MRSTPMASEHPSPARTGESAAERWAWASSRGIRLILAAAAGARESRLAGLVPRERKIGGTRRGGRAPTIRAQGGQRSGVSSRPAWDRARRRQGRQRGMTYDEGIGWLFSLHRFGMKLGLANMQALTDAIGRPQDHFQSVLVAGTNGKGSTSAMLHSILVASGRRAGLYTSPHLVRTEERIRIDEREIGADEITSLINEVRGRIDRLLAKEQLAAHPTFFEVITCVALLAFVRAGVEIAVLEVGLGGRLDATNVADPVLSIITNIDFDHQEQLGPTLASIPRDKAGIMRRGVPALVGDVADEALRVIREEARRTGARLILVSEGSSISSARALSPLSHPEFSITTPVREYPSRPCPPPGAPPSTDTPLA